MIMGSCIGFLPNTRRDFTQGKIAWVSEKEMPNVVCLAKCGTLELFNNSNQEVLSFGTNNGEFAEIITEGRYHLKYYKTACVCYRFLTTRQADFFAKFAKDYYWRIM